VKEMNSAKPVACGGLARRDLGLYTCTLFIYTLYCMYNCI